MLTSCPTNAALDGVVFIMRSTRSSFMHMVAATAIRKGTKLKAVFWRPALLSCMSHLHWHAHNLPCSGQPSPHLRRQSNSSSDMMTGCNQLVAATNLLRLKRCAHTAGHLQVFLQVFYLSSVQVPC